MRKTQTISRRDFSASAIALIWGGLAHAENIPNTKGSIKRTYPGVPDFKESKIHSPGHYKLEEDLIQRHLFGSGHDGPKGALLAILCGRVDLDLGGHKIGASYGMSGIEVLVPRNRSYARDWPDEYSNSTDNRYVSVRNGTIDFNGGKSTGRGICFLNQWDPPDLLTLNRPRNKYSPDGTASQSKYEQNEYLLENLKIYTSGAIGIATEGAKTVIRNCTIESSGNACIFSAGPDLLIENCEIRLRDAEKGYWSAHRPTRAGIVVRDGTNAVIRNNRIRVDYGGVESDSLCILVGDGAQNVLVEGNTFVNLRGAPVTLKDDAVANIRNNKVEETKSLWPFG